MSQAGDNGRDDEESVVSVRMDDKETDPVTIYKCTEQDSEVK